jgi:hypothetical protein
LFAITISGLIEYIHMKKKLFTLHDATADALDEHKKSTGVDMSAFADAVIAQALGVTLPESAVERRVALESVGAPTGAFIPVDDKIDTPADEPAAPVNAGFVPATEPATAFEAAMNSRGSAEPEAAASAEEAPVQGFKPPIVNQPVPVTAGAGGAEMPLVEPIQSNNAPVQPEPAKDGVRVCPNGHGEYDTPFCLDCI